MRTITVFVSRKFFGDFSIRVWRAWQRPYGRTYTLYVPDEPFAIVIGRKLIVHSVARNSKLRAQHGERVARLTSDDVQTMTTEIRTGRWLRTAFDLLRLISFRARFTITSGIGSPDLRALQPVVSRANLSSRRRHRRRAVRRSPRNNNHYATMPHVSGLIYCSRRNKRVRGG